MDSPASIKEGRLSKSFREENSDLEVDYLMEAGHFYHKFESPDAFTVHTDQSSQKYDFLQFHAKVLKGEVAALGGDVLREYSDTKEDYYRFLDRYRPARACIERRKQYDAAFSQFRVVLEKQLRNNFEFLRGYRHIAARKDPFTEIVTSMPVDEDVRKTILSVSKEVTDAGILKPLKDKIEQ